MKVILTRTGAECPILAQPPGAPASNPGLPDAHGAFSVEEFPYTDDLKRTHEDAEGFVDYLENWYPKNFWYKDANVRNWAFYEDYDNWQDTYGVDAVLAAYLSSHGAMEPNGNFRGCMGSEWSDKGYYAFSHDMRIGNEQANYVWWSTCLSMRIFDGHDPIRSWSPASLGFRMMFGYETVSVDDGDYGEDFWDEWNDGKSLSTAFLDASWGISSDQIPVALAVGSTKAEAIDRVFNERMLHWGHVSDSWWWWRWYEKANPARRAPNRALPAEPMIAVLKRREVDGRYVRNVMRRHKLDIPLPRQAKANIKGTFHVRHEDMRLSFRSDGAYEIEYGRPTLSNLKPLAEDDAIAIAERFVRDEGLSRDVDLAFDCIRLGKLAGRSLRRKRLDGPHTTETTVEFTQVVNGVPVISQKRGRLRISIDNDGRVTRLQNHTREVEGLSRYAKGHFPGPGMPLRMHELGEYRRLLSREWERRKRVRAALGKEPSEMVLLPGSDEIGYEIVGNEMAVYARGLIEIIMPGGFRKRYYVSRPVLQ